MGETQRSGFGRRCHSCRKAFNFSRIQRLSDAPRAHGRTMRSKLSFTRQPSTCSFTLLEFENHVTQVFGSEIGPPFGKKTEFGERAFPEQKIGEALLAAGANQEIDIGRTTALDFG